MSACTLWIPSATTLSPGFNPPERSKGEPTRSPTLTGLILILLSLAHYGHLVTTLQLCHRTLGNKEGAFFSRSDRPYASELAGAKRCSRIREQSLQPVAFRSSHPPGGLRKKSCLRGVTRSVSQNHFQP